MKIVDQTDRAAESDGAVTLINIFTPKPGQTEAFIAAQTHEYARLKGRVTGWLGNHLHRSIDGTRLVNIAEFESLDAYNAWRHHADFADHVQRIRPFVETAEPMLFGAPIYLERAPTTP